MIENRNWNDCTTRTIPHGRVNCADGDFQVDCPYECFTGYEKLSFSGVHVLRERTVFCNSGRWETWDGDPPCIATKRTPSIKIPTGLPFNFDGSNIKIPTGLPSNFDVPGVYPYVPTRDPSARDPVADSNGSAATFGVILAGVFGMAILLTCCLTCLIKYIKARRRAKARSRAIRNLVILHNAYSPPTQRRSQTTGTTAPHTTQLGASSPSSSNSMNNSTTANTPPSRNGNRREDNPSTRENNDGEGGLIFLYIRRLIPIFRHPEQPVYPPEPPPYDAESAAPPPYEEEGAPTSYTQQPNEPPPPYTINIPHV